MIGLVHLDPVITIPVGLLLVAGLVWYWHRLGHGDVPRSRRRIRRASLGLMLAATGLLVAGLSLLDPDAPAQAQAYLLIWIGVALAMLGLVIAAMCDACNNVRLHRDHSEQARRHLNDDVAHLVNGPGEERHAGDVHR